MESLRRTLGTAVLAAAVLSAAAISVLFLAPGLVGAEASYVVLSDSMSPTISAGDVVVVRSADPGSLERGDVITYEGTTSAGPGRVTHRVVGVERTDDGLRFRTKGDANEQPDDELVPAEDVIGEVWFSVPLVGRFLVFASSGRGILALIVLPAVLLVLTEVHSLYRELEDSEGGETE